MTQVEVVLAGLEGDQPVKCSRGVVLVPDAALQDVANESFGAIICPGGAEGARNLCKSAEVGQLLRLHLSSGARKILGFICAGVTVLKAHGKHLALQQVKDS